MHRKGEGKNTESQYILCRRKKRSGLTSVVQEPREDVCHRGTFAESDRHEQDAEGTDEEEELHEDQTIDDHLICSQ